MNRKKMKMLIELSSNVKEADAVVEELGFGTIKEKIAFLKGMFDFSLIGRNDIAEINPEEAEKTDYYAMLSTIINKKWEG